MSKQSLIAIFYRCLREDQTFYTVHNHSKTWQMQKKNIETQVGLYWFFNYYSKSLHIFVSLIKGSLLKNISEIFKVTFQMGDNGKLAYGGQHYDNSTF